MHYLVQTETHRYYPINYFALLFLTILDSLTLAGPHCILDQNTCCK